MMIAIYSLISIAFLFFLVFGPFNEYRVAKLRQELFFIRDRLFSEAAKGKVDFDSQAYGYTRLAINGMIRFAHRLSLARCLTAYIVVGREEIAEANEQQGRAFNSSPERDRNICQEHLRLANVAMVKHLGTSPYSFLVLVPLIATVVTLVTGMSLTGLVVKKCRDLFARLDAMAVAEGKAALYSGQSMGTTY